MAFTLGAAILVIWIGMHVAPRFTTAVVLAYILHAVGVVV